MICKKYNVQCCFAGGLAGDKCTILTNTDFKDGACHFRKLTPEGKNLYDEARKEKRGDKNGRQKA